MFREREILMNGKMEVLKRAPLLVALLSLAVVSIAVVRATEHGGAKEDDRVASEQWEYLAVAGPGTTNFTPTGNSRMRKEPTAQFGREAFVLEQHMDKLGANGWEL